MLMSADLALLLRPTGTPGPSRRPEALLRAAPGSRLSAARREGRGGCGGVKDPRDLAVTGPWGGWGWVAVRGPLGSGPGHLGGWRHSQGWVWAVHPVPSDVPSWTQRQWL